MLTCHISSRGQGCVSLVTVVVVVTMQRGKLEGIRKRGEGGRRRRGMFLDAPVALVVLRAVVAAVRGGRKGRSLAPGRRMRTRRR